MNKKLPDFQKFLTSNKHEDLSLNLRIQKFLQQL